MRKLTVSLIHFAIAVCAFVFGSKLFGQSYNQPILLAETIQRIEIVPYRLVPSYDVHCQISVELVEPSTFLTIPDIYKEEIYEILIERVVFEETNPFAQNEAFRIDDKTYQLVKLPNTGDTWYNGTWNHNE